MIGLAATHQLLHHLCEGIAPGQVLLQEPMVLQALQVPAAILALLQHCIKGPKAAAVVFAQCQPLLQLPQHHPLAHA